MEPYNRVQHLKQIHKAKKDRTNQKVDEAIKRLIRGKERINFNSVSNESGITKATLYNNKNIRTRIEDLRNQEAQVPTPRQVKREMNETNKDAVIASLKRKNKKLEAEISQLKAELQAAHSLIYSKI